MKKCGTDFQVTSSAVLNSLSGLSVGNNVYIGTNTVVLGIDIFIEDEVLIGPNNIISSGNHTMENRSFRFGKPSRDKIILGKGSWVAGNCSILPGAVLPESSILGAGSVLNKPFTEKQALYVGAPAVFKKKLNDNQL